MASLENPDFESGTSAPTDHPQMMLAEPLVLEHSEPSAGDRTRFPNIPPYYWLMAQNEHCCLPQKFAASTLASTLK